MEEYPSRGNSMCKGLEVREGLPPFRHQMFIIARSSRMRWGVKQQKQRGRQGDLGEILEGLRHIWLEVWVMALLRKGAH